ARSKTKPASLGERSVLQLSRSQAAIVLPGRMRGGLGGDDDGDDDGGGRVIAPARVYISPPADFASRKTASRAASISPRCVVENNRSSECPIFSATVVGPVITWALPGRWGLPRKTDKPSSSLRTGGPWRPAALSGPDERSPAGHTVGTNPDIHYLQNVRIPD